MNKYRAVKETVNGVVCDSMAEARRYRDLLALERCGEIRNLSVHPRFPLVVSRPKPLDATMRDGDARLVCTYEADFTYLDREGRLVVEDVKGMRTGPAWSHFRTKAKLFAALHGIEVSIYPPIQKKPRRKKAA